MFFDRSTTLISKGKCYAITFYFNQSLVLRESRIATCLGIYIYGHYLLQRLFIIDLWRTFSF